jgi:murein DD-endopeptidase MepM/ murein hydrolase activator NlpD
MASVFGGSRIFSSERQELNEAKVEEAEAKVEYAEAKVKDTEAKIEEPKVDDPKSDDAKIEEPSKTETKGIGFRQNSFVKEASDSSNNTGRSASVFGTGGSASANGSGGSSSNGSRAISVFSRTGVSGSSSSGVFGRKTSSTASVGDAKQTLEVEESKLNEGYESKDFLWPVKKGKVTSLYGWRTRKRFHDGIDIAAPSGTPIFAAKGGKVVYSANKIGGYGNMVVIKHENKYYTVYAHNRVNKVSKGDMVRKGEVIAELGNSGRSRGPHLHFEIRKGKYSVDPMKYFNYAGHENKNRNYGFIHEFK